MSSIDKQLTRRELFTLPKPRKPMVESQNLLTDPETDANAFGLWASRLGDQMLEMWKRGGYLDSQKVAQALEWGWAPEFSNEALQPSDTVLHPEAPESDNIIEYLEREQGAVYRSQLLELWLDGYFSFQSADEIESAEIPFDRLDQLAVALKKYYGGPVSKSFVYVGELSLNKTVLATGSEAMLSLITYFRQNNQEIVDLTINYPPADARNLNSQTGQGWAVSRLIDLEDPYSDVVHINDWQVDLATRRRGAFFAHLQSEDGERALKQALNEYGVPSIALLGVIGNIVDKVTSRGKPSSHNSAVRYPQGYDQWRENQQRSHVEHTRRDFLKFLGLSLATLTGLIGISTTLAPEKAYGALPFFTPESKRLAMYDFTTIFERYARWLRKKRMGSSKLTLTDRHGEPLQDLNEHFFISLEEIPDLLINTVVALEDDGFWKHRGVTLGGMGRGARQIVADKLGRSSGGGTSTLTMQMVELALRDVYGAQGYSEYLRAVGASTAKASEITVATMVEEQLYQFYRQKYAGAINADDKAREAAKKEIITYYLNLFQPGTDNKAPGLKSAAQRYTKHGDLQKLIPLEQVIFALLPNNPNIIYILASTDEQLRKILGENADIEATRRYVYSQIEVTIQILAEQGQIDQGQHLALAQALHGLKSSGDFGTYLPSIINNPGEWQHPFYRERPEWVRGFLDYADLLVGGEQGSLAYRLKDVTGRVELTMDREMQRYCFALAQEVQADNHNKTISIVVRRKSTGEVLAVTGPITDIPLGSTTKVVTYHELMAAFGYGEDDKLSDAPFNIVEHQDGQKPKPWIVENDKGIDFNLYGFSTMGELFAQSCNRVPAWLAVMRFGAVALTKSMAKFGLLDNPLDELGTNQVAPVALANVLGVFNSSLSRLAAMFASMANQGKYVGNGVIRVIEERASNSSLVRKLYQAKQVVQQVGEPKASREIMQILSNPGNVPATDLWHPFQNQLAKHAMKTGTSERFEDPNTALFHQFGHCVGSTLEFGDDDIVVAVSARVDNSGGASGLSDAAPLVLQIMEWYKSQFGRLRN